MVTSPNMVIVVKQRDQQRDQLLHKYTLKYHTRIFWLAWLSNLTFESPRLAGENFTNFEP
jgi:hypothetical protein